MIEMTEKNIDKVIEITTGYKFLLDRTYNGRMIAVYERGEDIKILKMSEVCEVERVETITKEQLISAAFGTIGYLTLDSLLDSAD